MLQPLSQQARVYWAYIGYLISVYDIGPILFRYQQYHISDILVYNIGDVVSIYRSYVGPSLANR